jgi:hypothetical protein
VKDKYASKSLGGIPVSVHDETDYIDRTKLTFPTVDNEKESFLPPLDEKDAEWSPNILSDRSKIFMGKLRYTVDETELVVFTTQHLYLLKQELYLPKSETVEDTKEIVEETKEFHRDTIITRHDLIKILNPSKFEDDGKNYEKYDLFPTKITACEELTEELAKLIVDWCNHIACNNRSYQFNKISSSNYKVFEPFIKNLKYIIQEIFFDKTAVRSQIQEEFPVGMIELLQKRKVYYITIHNRKITPRLFASILRINSLKGCRFCDCTFVYSKSNMREIIDELNDEFEEYKGKREKFYLKFTNSIFEETLFRDKMDVAKFYLKILANYKYAKKTEYVHFYTLNEYELDYIYYFMKDHTVSNHNGNPTHRLKSIVLKKEGGEQGLNHKPSK